jgi:LPXTG-site transpeptidase (sortase) family protein
MAISKRRKAKPSRAVRRAAQHKSKVQRPAHKKARKRVSQQETAVSMPVAVSRFSALTRFTPWVPKNWQAWLMMLGITLGINMVCASGWYYLYSKTVLSFAVVPQVVIKPELRGSIPQQVKLPNLGLEYSLEVGAIVDGIWQTSQTKPTYLITSGRPGENTNIVIYGHNYPSIFTPLKKMQIGNTIEIITENKQHFVYEVKDIVVVSPSAIEQVAPTDHEVLTLYTCTGLFDSQRLVIKAFPKSVGML